MFHLREHTFFLEIFPTLVLILSKDTISLFAECYNHGRNTSYTLVTWFLPKALKHSAFGMDSSRALFTSLSVL